MECSWNDRGKTKYYIVIFDQLQGYSGGLIRALELCVRGPLTEYRKRELAVPFTFWAIFILTRYCDYVTI